MKNAINFVASTDSRIINKIIVTFSVNIRHIYAKKLVDYLLTDTV